MWATAKNELSLSDRLLLFLIALLLWFKTHDFKQAREAALALATALGLSEELAGFEDELLTEEEKVYVKKQVLNNNYGRARKYLERRGYKVIRISRRRGVVTVELDVGVVRIE